MTLAAFSLFGTALIKMIKHIRVKEAPISWEAISLTSFGLITSGPGDLEIF
jgi:hypothetical protein